MSQHILGNFDEALNSLRNDVLTMGSLTNRSLQNAVGGLFRRDTDLCRAAIADDEELDELEKQVDRDGVNIMLRFQPVATDLRRVIAAMKIGSNLERVGDLAVGIARRARKLSAHPELPETLRLEPAFQAAHQLFKDSLRAFSEEDEALGRGLKPRDAEVDRLCKEFDRSLSEAMVRNSEQIRGYMNLLIICRNIERVGDHATNIGEDAVFIAAAEDIRHTSGQASK